MRRLCGCLVAFVLTFLAVSPAPAQEPGDVRLTLAKQTPWNSFHTPKLEVRVRAENTGNEELDHLSLAVYLFAAVRSRSEYELSLTADPTAQVAFEVIPLDGSLDPGATRDFPLERNLTEVPTIVGAGVSLIYPMKVELRTLGTPLAELRSPIVFLVEHPKTPLGITWTVVLDEQILFDPNGVFRSSALERQLAPGGRLTAEIASLLDVTRPSEPMPLHLAVSPTLLTQLLRMRNGYAVSEGDTTRQVPAGEGGAEDAAAALEDLRKVASAPHVQLSALPFSTPILPALLDSGLSHDFRVQLERGRARVKRALGVEPSVAVFRPPRSAIDQATLEALSKAGEQTLLLDAGTLPEPSQPLGFATPPVAALPVGPSRSLTAIVPDEAAHALLVSSQVRDDPVLGAHAALGDLAAVWLESPSLQRAIAVTFSELESLPSAFYGPFARGVAQAPWLAPITAHALVALAEPPEEPSRVGIWRGGGFGRGYVRDVKQARQRIEDFDSMLVRPSAVPAALETSLLLSESGEFLYAENLGRAFIDSVGARLSAQFAKVTPDVSQPVTLTSSHGVIPVRIHSDSAQPLRVVVQLASPRLTFSRGNSKQVELTRPDQTLLFGVQLQTTGRFPVQVLVRAPTGAPINSATLVVRSTAYNRVALFITLGALLVLLLLWFRRLARGETA